MDASSFRTPLSLPGRFVRLVPLAAAHREVVRAAAADPEVGRYLLNGPGLSFDEADALLEFLRQGFAAGTDLPFTTVRATDGVPVGMTRYLHIDRRNHSVEVGGTWLLRGYWRTPFNTESKYLLLRHAFETEAVHRVWLQTDARNERSRRAIARIGAVEEAALREDKRLADGTYRTSVHFAILREEWPAVRSRLEEMLRRPWSPSA